jgi:hypothetical protein
MVISNLFKIFQMVITNIFKIFQMVINCFDNLQERINMKVRDYLDDLEQ